MVVFSKSQAKLALKLLGKIDHIDTPDLRVSLTKIKKYLADSSFKIKIDYLLDSNYQLKDFETFFKNMDDIAPRGLDKLEILPKISIVLKESDIDEEKKQEYHRKIEILKKDILNNLSAFEKINLDIISGKIVLANEFPHYQLNYTKPTSYFEEIILTIDEAISLDLDGAFQIKEQGDLYILDVYITDVPSFLMTNDTLFWEAYKRGSSCYAHFADKQLAVNMLPVELANNLLSLRQETVHRVIDFTFIIGKKGQIYDTKLSFKDIKILKNIPLQKRKVLLLILTI